MQPAGTGPDDPFLDPSADWRARFRELEAFRCAQQHSRPEPWAEKGEILYLFDIARTLAGGKALVRLLFREGTGPSSFRELPQQGLALPDLQAIADLRDREILAMLRGIAVESRRDEAQRLSRVGRAMQIICPSYRLDVDLVRLLLPKMCETGRLFLARRGAIPVGQAPLLLDVADSWEFGLKLAASRTGRGYRLRGFLRQKGQVMSLLEPDLFLVGGLMIARGRLSRYLEEGAFAWIRLLRRSRQISVAEQDLSRFLAQLCSLPGLPALEIEESTAIRTLRVAPQPRLRLGRADRRPEAAREGGLVGELFFLYEKHLVDDSTPAGGFYAPEDKQMVLRQPEKEKELLERLLELGFRRARDHGRRSGVLRLAARRLPAVVELLLRENWQVEAEGRLLRGAGGFALRVVSALDWFELRGTVSFGQAEVPLPELLGALRKGGNMVRLGDGSFGVLPEEWLKQQGFLLELGEVREDHLRFRSSQAALIDLFLQSQPHADCDRAFTRLREKLEAFPGIRAADPPPGFGGRLRGYQREGLGWFRFLDKLEFGGCLADDMGLGKTVQVLALLESRRRRGADGTAAGAEKRRPPSLVVVPKSLVFNWKLEASRFTPGLKVLDHSGPGRPGHAGAFAACDVVLTTYGTMRNDIALLKDFRFDYLILDEAQIIKNANSLTARAARLLQGGRRLALSGTPIENHLGELWSLFEFLNPGILGGVSFFRRYLKSRGSLEERSRALLARFLRPFILRRTKEQVAPELPDKVEQTLYCELEPAERRRYNELRDYYRSSLERRIASEGLGQAKIHVLEALLRLRQAACHPGLLDRRKVGSSSAKIDMLMQHLEDVLAEERKALVFSQFTGLLGILRGKLDRREIPYEYLDGRSRNRAGRVQRFQEDPRCPLFLISLKAGGLGLNLTAAEYVFLLDPWWNPAAEAQAIDRSHRIGQDRKVFAYRLIARETVEERVLELQRSKRELAESIISADSRLIGRLSREDLNLLLS